MDDRIIQPAFAVFNSPGVYALLLGSGVSRSAEIMTGWEILNDLIRKIADALGETISSEPYEWYRQKFNTEAAYDVVLEHLGSTRMDRRAIVERYLVPIEDDLENDRKQPTRAHDAIAWLVKQGFIRVILTTNFDRLLEMALAKIGVVSQVLSTEDMFVNRTPLRHTPVTIIKIHGDYLDENLRNTAQELTEYSPGLQTVIHEVLSDYGLIVSGWSADYDRALVRLIEEHKTNRYSTYWVSYGMVGETASALMHKLNAVHIENVDAEQFFGELQSMVEVLQGRADRVPLTTEMAVARVKKMIPRPELQIDLKDFIMELAVKGYNACINAEFRSKLPVGPMLTDDILDNYIMNFVDVLQAVLACSATIFLHGSHEHRKIVLSVIDLWRGIATIQGFQSWIGYLPNWILIYVCGVSSISSGNNSNLLELFELTIKINNKQPRVRLITYIAEKFHRFYLRGPNVHLKENAIGRSVSRHIHKLVRTDAFVNNNFDNSFSLFEAFVGLLQIRELPASDQTNSESPYFTTSPILPHQPLDGAVPYINDFWYHAGKQSLDWNLLRVFADTPETMIKHIILYEYALTYIYGFPDLYADTGIKYTEEYQKGLEDNGNFRVVPWDNK